MNTPSTQQGDFFAVEGLEKSFDGKVVLKDATFTIPPGETTVILGGSGAGKSVLLKHLNGLMLPDAGSVCVDGEPLSGKSELDLIPIRKKIGILFQDGALFDSMTVGENVAFPLKEHSKLSPSEIEERVEEVLKQVDLSEASETMPGELSGGMKKRAGLARAIIQRPEAMLYDEPTAGLDPVLSAKVARLINQLTEELALTSVVVTHNLDLMKEVADRVIFLQKGKAIFSGTLEELMNYPEEPVRHFIDGKSTTA